jgi:hypothetical protein
VQVDDLEATLDHANVLGGRVVKSPQPIPGSGRVATFEDVEGNVSVCLMQYEVAAHLRSRTSTAWIRIPPNFSRLVEDGSPERSWRCRVTGIALERWSRHRCAGDVASQEAAR